MSKIRTTLFELSKIELPDSLLEDLNHYVSPDHLRKVEQQLREVPSINVNQTGCCIIIRRDGIGNLYATNYSGAVEDVLGRRVFIETEDADKISDADALVIVLLAIINSGFGMHKNNDDTVITQLIEDAITIPQYRSFPCVAQMARGIRIHDYIQAIAEIEGPQHRQRLTGYIDCVNVAREMDMNHLDLSEKPIYLEKGDGGIFIYGEPESDPLDYLLTRSVKVYSKELTSQEEIVARMFHAWSIDGAGLESGPFQGANNYFGITAHALQEDIQRGLVHGTLPSSEEIQELKLFQNLSYAYSILSKHLGKQYSYKTFLDRAVDIHTFRIETTNDVSINGRMEFFETILSSMEITKSVEYNCILMMVATAPSSPFANGLERMKILYHQHLYKEGVNEFACYHGYIPFSDETGRAILYIFCLTTKPIEG